MKTKNEYPPWAEKYRSKGRTIRKVRNGYGLYECTSVYVKGQKYPKSVQKYLGMITEKDGFIPKKIVPSSPQYKEYGLSHFIMLNFKREIARAVYHSSSELVILGVIHFIFNSADPVFIRATWISHDIEDKLIDYSLKISPKRILLASGKVEKILIDHIPDDNDRNTIVKLLMLTVIETTAGTPKSVVFPTEVTDILKGYGLKYE